MLSDQHQVIEPGTCVLFRRRLSERFPTAQEEALRGVTRLHRCRTNRTPCKVAVAYCPASRFYRQVTGPHAS